MKLFISLILGSLLLAACVAGATQSPDTAVTSPPVGQIETPAPAEWDPAPGDEKLDRAGIEIMRSDILILESYPPQFVLSLAGELPSQCHKLRVIVNAPDEQRRIQVEVYTLVEPGVICTLMTAPFSVNLPLGSYTEGKYSVWVNGQQVGEIAP